MMRKLLLACVGYSSALILSHYLLPVKLLPWLALGCAAISLIAFAFRGNARAAALIVLLSASVGFIWNYGHGQIFIAPAEKLVGSTLRVEARLTDYPDVSDNYSSMTVKLIGEGLPDCRVLVTDYNGIISVLQPGDTISAELEFRSAGERFNAEDDYYFSSGIFLRAYINEFELISGDADNILYWPKHLAFSLKERIMTIFPDDVAHLAKALLTGDKSELYEDDSLYVSMKVAGLSHIVAVSGMHVSFIIGLLGVFTRRRRLTAFLGIPLVWFFAAMVGFGPSVTRASFMMTLLLAAPLLRRENDPPTSLAAALLLLLLINPRAVGSVSLQLSFGAMAGIILITPRIYASVSSMYSENSGFIRRIGASANGMISASVGAMVFTTPLIALHFGFVSLYSVLTNLLCLWAMSASFMLGYVSCIVSAVWLGGGAALAWLASWLLRYSIVIVKFISRLPLAALFTYNNLVGWWLIFAYAVIIVPWFFRGRKAYRPIIPICCALIALPAVIFVSNSLSERSPAVTAVNVGQGQCIVATTQYSTVVIDCGGKGSAENAGDSAAEFILSSGRREVDLLVLTHLHDDHANGVTRLMNYLDVKRVAIPADCEETEIGDRILETCYNNSTEVFMIEENTRIISGSLSLELFAPIGSEDPNEKGLIILGDYGEFEFLVTGDAGSGTEKQLVSFYPIGDIEMLVAGHHGSKYSTSEALLDAVTPEYAVISVGVNSYGHPTEEVLERLNCRGIETYRTDHNGNITIMAGNKDG